MEVKLMDLESKDFNVLLNNFYNYYLVDYIEEVISDDNEEVSAVLLINALEYFLELCERTSTKIPFHDLESYLKLNYFDYEEIHKNIMEKYNKEKSIYNGKMDFREEMSVLRLDN